MKEQVLDMSKQHLRRIVEDLDYRNLAEMEKDFTRIFVILYSTRDLLTLHPVAAPVQEENDWPDNQQNAAIEFEKKTIEEQEAKDFEMAVAAMEMDADDGRIPYRFDRKIRGGYIQEIDAFVPEKIVNELDLHHGDLLYAKLIKQVPGGPDHYDYEVAERGSGKSPEGIVEVNWGIVEYYPATQSGFAVTRTSSGQFADGITLHGEKLTLTISDDDANMFKLQEDDIIDLAFYENNPENPKVRWRHSFSETRKIEAATPKPSGYYKSKKQDGKEELDQVFEGKTICCMGYEPGWSDFRDEIEKRGGEFIGVTGRESRDSLAGTLSKSDCLIMTLGHVGHGGTQWAVPYCKNNGIPYTSIKTFGRASFVLAADRLVNH
jgi:hypothetical protein